MTFSRTCGLILRTMRLFMYVYLHAQIVVNAGSEMQVTYSLDKSGLFCSLEKPKYLQLGAPCQEENGADILYLQSNSAARTNLKDTSNLMIDETKISSKEILNYSFF